ncbi:MAG TPA: hypothetical protein VGL26_02910 [Jatrophihabitans sp.]
MFWVKRQFEFDDIIQTISSVQHGELTEHELVGSGGADDRLLRVDR